MTDASGYCMCGTAERGGKRVITVGLRCLDNDARFTDTIAMFDYGFEKLGVKEDEKTDAAESGDDVVKVRLDGNYVTFEDQPPVIIDGRTLVPLRGVMEAMGKTVEWNGEQRMITVYDESTTIQLRIDSPSMVTATDSTPVTTELDVPPTIINDRTCLPIRAVAEGFGAKVDWDGSTKTVIIDTGASA